MNAIQKKIVTILMFLVMSVTVTCEEKAAHPFVLITIPKSGSHLIIKALYFLTGSEPVWHTQFPSYQYIPSDVAFLYTHFCVFPELEADYQELPYLKKIILVRDLRDVAVSIIHQIKKNFWPGLTREEREAFLALSFDEQLLFVIDFEYDPKTIAEKAPNSLQVSLIRVAEQALRYLQNPDILTIYYEDLVGPQGGGTTEAQLTQIKRIKEFLQLDVPEAFLHVVARSLYGDDVNPFGTQGFKNFESTFHSGKVGKWKEVFKEEHKDAFKKKMGDLLIALGYEENNNW